MEHFPLLRTSKPDMHRLCCCIKRRTVKEKLNFSLRREKITTTGRKWIPYNYFSVFFFYLHFTLCFVSFAPVWKINVLLIACISMQFHPSVWNTMQAWSGNTWISICFMGSFFKFYARVNNYLWVTTWQIHHTEWNSQFKYDGKP